MHMTLGWWVRGGARTILPQGAGLPASTVPANHKSHCLLVQRRLGEDNWKGGSLASAFQTANAWGRDPDLSTCTAINGPW
jgi:hypothetical protein